ncbi:sensor histidine kinase [Herbiconiux sp. L3-i23]|uniref:sensor histidine kinase n=1 Tax=Herbiconiux sp. L3-i23 TaxID=2905871 RepID=UPI0020613253|nr:histidine kinase [Herbiconiux sp. L3-i23]BDI23418.1 hypothetical protein L3i23_21940 [Herbiconiux sp. L3-i23]
MTAESTRRFPRATASARIATVAALVIAGLSSIGAIALDIAILADYAPSAVPMSTGWSGALPGLAMVLPGALLLWRLPWHPIATILVVFGVLWCVDGLAAAAVNYSWLYDRDAPFTGVAFWYYARFGSVLILPIQLLLVLFPTGRLPRPPVWRGIGITALVLAVIMPIAFILAPRAAMMARAPSGGIDPDAATQSTAIYDHPLITLPLPTEMWLGLFTVAVPATVLSLLLALAVAIGRSFGASPVEKSQLRWFVWAGALFIVLMASQQLFPLGISDGILTLAIALVSASVVVAVARYRLYEIDRLLSWTLLYGLLVGSIVAVDGALVLTLGAVIDDGVLMLVAVVLVTLVYAPLRDRLFGVVNRVVNGRRSDPYGVVSALAGELEDSLDTPTQLGAVADAIADAFASTYVAVELERPDGDLIRAEHGTRHRDTVDLPLEYRGRRIGRIVMKPGRRPRLSARDQKLLGDLVRLAAAAMLNAELSAELQAIRENLVSAREEERSRIRRELHDGLGPLLGGVKLRLETARNFVGKDPGRSVEFLDKAIADSAEVILEIRRLVQDLRPPALDDLGLRRAVEQQAERLRGPSLAIEVSGEIGRSLPAAVEVAAYRIVSEALNNVSRHSRARSASVVLDAGAAALVATVTDDGTGIDDDAVRGVGLRSMRERATELGGSLEITVPEGGGTTVRARLPLPAEPTAPAPDVDEEIARVR